jgi:DNA/RNA-binding domain of Phe-tRNA-synthetase-like protein
MQVTASEALAAALSTESSKLVSIDEATRKAVRDLLRHGGYKPTGRGKPSSEYLLGVAAEGTLPRINPAVDAGNAVSLRTSYVFNASGQTIDLGGLLCLHDEEGPCANAVKDAQRTKTNGETCHVLVVIWGTRALPGQTQAAAASVQALLESCGATVTPVATA